MDFRQDLLIRGRAKIYTFFNESSKLYLPNEKNPSLSLYLHICSLKNANLIIIYQNKFQIDRIFKMVVPSFMDSGNELFSLGGLWNIVNNPLQMWPSSFTQFVSDLPKFTHR